MAKRPFIDSHIHVVTKSYADAIEAAGGDPSGYPVPTWTETSCLQMMDQLRVERAILSVTSPGPSIAGNGVKGRALARVLNEEIEQIVARNPQRMSFFASTPDWTDVDGTLAELDTIFTQSKAVGVVVMTTYGDRLLGDPMFEAIWEKLNHYKAIVFVHPTSVNIKPTFIAGFLPQPTMDYPYSTTRTAVDLLMTGRFAACPDVDIILSHAGGVLPYLAPRLLEAIRSRSADSAQILEANMSRFYMDTALSGAPSQLESVIAFGAADRLLFGSDFPYAPMPMTISFARQLDGFIASNPKGQQISAAKLTRNAIRLFQKHGINIFNEMASL